jgi:hypothetical protein
MKKLEILTKITENLELMQAIERVVNLSDGIDPFIDELMTEWHELAQSNMKLRRYYQSISHHNEKDLPEILNPFSMQFDKDAFDCYMDMQREEREYETAKALRGE